MAGSTLNREDYKTAIPQLSSQMKEILDNNIVINRTVINLTEGKVSDLNSYLGYFQSLTTGYFQAIAGDVQFLSSRQAYLGQLKADIAGFGYLTAETADLRYATIQNLTAATARISDLEADHVSVTDLTAATGRISALEADHVSTSDLAAVNADVSHLKVGDLTIGGVTVNIYDLALAIKNSAMASGTTWYKVSATTPTAPTAFDPTSEGWSQTEPSYTGGTTTSLYSCLRVVYADDDPTGTRHYQWSDVHKIQSWEAAKEAYAYADDANDYAEQAQFAADSAMKGLGQVEDVVGVLEWITNHGTMESQQGETFDENNVYFVVDPNGDYVIGGTHYSLVTNPVAADIDSYYCLSVDRSIQNYVATHIVVDSEGLWIIPDSGGNKVLIATGGTGKRYETAGTYIVSRVGNNDVTLASFATDGVQIGRDNETHVDIDYHSLQLVDKDGTTYFHVSDLRNKRGYMVDTFTTPSSAESPFTYELLYAGKSIVGVYLTESGGGEIPSYMYSFAKNLNQLTMNHVSSNTRYFVEYELDYDFFEPTAFTFGTRITPETVETKLGLRSSSFGHRNIATGVGAFASGTGNNASGDWSHALGESCVAAGRSSVSSGYGCETNGNFSHAQNERTVADYDDQTAIGKFNDNQQNNAFEIGNGTDDNNRSNAFEVDWNGNTTAGGDITAVGDIEDGQGNVLSDKADTSSLATVATSGSYDDLSNKPTIPPVSPDYIVEAGNESGWTYRKWNSGKVEAWYDYSGSAGTFTTWVAPIRRKDVAVSIPSGIFTASPKLFPVSRNNQFWVVHASPSSATSVTVRLATVASSSLTPSFRVYATSY